MEPPKNDAMPLGLQSQTPPKIPVCFCKTEPCVCAQAYAAAVLVHHLFTSVVFVGLCCLVASAVGQFGEEQLFSTWPKIGVGLAVVAIAHVLLSLVLFHAVKMRDVRLSRGCVYVTWMLSLAALGYIIFSAPWQTQTYLVFSEESQTFAFVTYSAGSPPPGNIFRVHQKKFSWTNVLSLLKRLPVLVGWVYCMGCLHGHTKLLKSPEAMDKLYEECRETP